MSVLRKAVATAATLAVVTGICAATTLTAGAATPECGKGCVEVFSPRFGAAENPGFVETVLGGKADSGTPMVLSQASSSNSAADIIPHLNKVSGFYTKGMVSAAVNQHYGSLNGAQLEFAPSGHATGLCVGLEGPASENKALGLQPCTVAGSTVFIVDTTHASATTPAFTPLVIGSTDDFVHPWTMVYDGTPTDQPTPQIRVSHMNFTPAGAVPINQLFGVGHGVLQ